MRHITITFGMKHLAIRMDALKKGTLLALATWSISLSLNAQGYYTKYCADKQLQKQAKAWLKKGEWRNGFTKADAHETVNAVEFYTQYKKKSGAVEKTIRVVSKHRSRCIAQRTRTHPRHNNGGKRGG